MKKVKITDFVKSPHKYFRQLPIVLTKYKKSMYKITNAKLRRPSVAEEPDFQPVVEAEAPAPQAVSEPAVEWYEDPDAKSILPQKCQICNQMGTDVKMIKFYADGETMAKDVCPKCARRIPEDIRV